MQIDSNWYKNDNNDNVKPDDHQYDHDQQMPTPKQNYIMRKLEKQ